MKHGVKKRTLGRDFQQREALLRSLAASLIKHEKIQTTEAKAKEVRPFVEKLITKAKTSNIHSRRTILKQLGNNKEATQKLVEDVAGRYAERPGGYTRIIKTTPRTSDSARMAIIELV